MTIPVIRKRAKRPKTRTGCRTCRMRHIKCDEERPICRRCRVSGKECLGYDVVRSDEGSKAHQAVLLPKGSQVASVNLPTLYPVPRSPAMTTREMSPLESYAFDFFRSQTVRQLPGSAWTLSWERLALQMGHYEPAVTHAAIALGSIHRALIYEPTHGAAGIDSEQHDFALSQYNIAMGHVRKYIETLDDSCSDSDVEVVLLVSLLFFCFEVLHSEDARATMHLRTGLRILYERIRKNNPPLIEDEYETKRVVEMQVTPRDNMDIILQTFVRLDRDLTIIGEDEPYLFPICREQVPNHFHTLEEAMVHLDAIAVKTHDFCRDMVLLADKEIVSRRADLDQLDEDMRSCLACAASRTMSLDSEPQLHSRMEEIKADLNTWTTALSHVQMDTQCLAAQLITQIHFFYIYFIVSTWRDENEMLVDRFDEQFDHVLGLAEQYVDMHVNSIPPPSSSSNSSSAVTSPTITSSSTLATPNTPKTPGFSTTLPMKTRQAFSLGTNLVPCISIIAFKSRSTSLRRRCVALLRTINLQGVFDSHFLASFIQIIWDLEEERARALQTSPSTPQGAGGGATKDFHCTEIPALARFVEIELSPMLKESASSASPVDVSVGASGAHDPAAGSSAGASGGGGGSDFYKMDIGRLVYVVCDEEGDLRAKEAIFRVERPVGGKAGHVCVS